jgi:hypothetical protein
MIVIKGRNWKWVERKNAYFNSNVLARENIELIPPPSEEIDKLKVGDRVLCEMVVFHKEELRKKKNKVGHWFMLNDFYFKLPERCNNYLQDVVAILSEPAEAECKVPDLEPIEHTGLTNRSEWHCQVTHNLNVIGQFIKDYLKEKEKEGK